MEHAIASHAAVSSLLAARSAHAVLGEDRLRELHEQAARERPSTGGSDEQGQSSAVRPSLLGVRCTEASVVASIFRKELHAMERGRSEEMEIASLQINDARTELVASSDTYAHREGALREQLASITHECWAAKEEAASVRHSVAEHQVCRALVQPRCMPGAVSSHPFLSLGSFIPPHLCFPSS